MFLICRKNSGQLNISCQGPCEEFVKTYLKYNLSDRDKANFVLLKAEELNIDDYMDASSEATPTASAEPVGKKKVVVPEKKTADAATNI